jgi:hypothetical protein
MKLSTENIDPRLFRFVFHKEMKSPLPRPTDPGILELKIFRERLASNLKKVADKLERFEKYKDADEIAF